MAKPTLSLDPFNTELMKRGVGGVPMTKKEAEIAKSGFVKKDNPATLIDNLQRGLNSFYQTIQAGGLSQQNQPYKVGESPLSKKSSVVEEQEDIFKPSPEIAIQPRVNFDEIAKAAVEEKKQNQEDFRKTEAALTEMQGGLKSQPVVDLVAGQGQDNNPNEDAATTAFLSSMDEFINSARDAAPYKPTERSIKEYKRAFAEATGIDISGKPDKSSALMSLGLALMQNRAGSGFNVGNILRAVGQAGEVALPKLEAAKKEARNDMIAAGKYALESQAVDKATDRAAEEKLKQRTDYYIIPKGEGISGTIAGLEKGKLQSLNLQELDALRKNENFSKQFDVLPGSMWSSVVAEALKTPEGKKLYRETPTTMNLFGSGDEAASGIFDIRIYDADPNTNQGGRGIIADSGRDAYRSLAAAYRDLQSSKQKFADGFDLAKGTNVARFTLDKVDSLAAAFGIGLSGANDTEKLKLFLTKLQAQNAKEILGEAGKTISDADRELVRSIVGDVTLFENEDRLRGKLTELYDDIIVKKERQIIEALRTLDYYNNTDIASRLDSGPLGEEDQAELESYLNSSAFSNILPSSQEKK
tara:strand:+ start:41 stop:1795 length:1755 start_codon:yes stop_codon:yes gene_type:complete